MSISELVTSNISLAASFAVQANFGRPLLLSDGAPYLGGRIYANSSAGRAAMVTDGWATSSSAYRQAVAIGAQSPGVVDFIAYGRTGDSDQEYQLVPKVTTQNFVYSFRVQGTAATPTTITYTVPGSATVASIVTALQALVDAVAGVDAADDTTHLTLTPTTAGTTILIDVPRAQFNVVNVGTNSSAAAALTAAVADFGDAFFAVLPGVGTNPTELEALSVAAESAKKLLMADLVESSIDAGTAGNPALLASAANRKFTWYFIHPNQIEQFAAAYAGRYLAQDPGAAKSGNLQVANVTGQTYGASALTNFQAANVTPYLSAKGVSFAAYGRVASGNSGSSTRDLEYTDDSIKTDYASFFASSPKVPYTQAGIDLTVSVLQGVLRRMVVEGIFDAGSVQVTYPVRSEIPAATVASGVLPDVTWSAIYSGEISKIEIEGLVSFG